MKFILNTYWKNQCLLCDTDPIVQLIIVSESKDFSQYGIEFFGDIHCSYPIRWEILGEKNE